MSHYTVGVGSRADLQRYARQADKARSAALKNALAVIRSGLGSIWKGWHGPRQRGEGPA